MDKADRADLGLSDGRGIEVVKGNRPPGSALLLERNGDGKRGVVFSPGKAEERGQGYAVSVGGALVRHKSLLNFIGPGQEEDPQRLADELGRFPLEQSSTNGRRCNDEPGLVNHHGEPTVFKLGRRIAGRLADSQPSSVGLWFSQGRHSAAGTLVLASSS